MSETIQFQTIVSIDVAFEVQRRPGSDDVGTAIKSYTRSQTGGPCSCRPTSKGELTNLASDEANCSRSRSQRRRRDHGAPSSG